MQSPLPIRSASALLAAPLCLFGATQAAAENSDDGASQATIVSGIAISNTSDLAFGSIIAGDAGGTVTIDASNGTASQIGETRLLPGPRGRARFVSNAPAGQLFLMVGDPATTLNRSGGGGTMTATLDYHANSGIGLVGGLFPSYVAILPSQEILVGGTLAVGGDQQIGDYAGSFTITMTYL